jgi:hypothetical protein
MWETWEHRADNRFQISDSEVSVSEIEKGGPFWMRELRLNLLDSGGVEAGDTGGHCHCQRSLHDGGRKRVCASETSGKCIRN